MNDRKWDTHKGYVESKNLTKLLDIIPFKTFSKSLEEIVNNKELFGAHKHDKIYLNSGPLRECISVFLKDASQLPETFNLYMFLKNIVDNGQPSPRSYVTILKPGGKIYEHCDAGGEYWNNINRYQFYFTGNVNAIQIIKDQQFKISPGYFYFFDHKQLHYYENNSNEDLILMVFDIQRNKNVL